MPKKGYSKRLSNQEVIQLLGNGRYSIDTEKGMIFGKTGRPLYTFTSRRTGGKWVRLYAALAMRSIPVAHCVWMFVTKHPIPRGFQIHHRNTNPQDDSWYNLFCLYRLDHSKLHNGHPDLLEETPF